MGHIERVLIASDLSPSAETVFAGIAPLLSRLRPVVDLAHVWQPVDGPARQELRHSLARARATLMWHGARDGRDLLIAGDPAEELLKLAERGGYDLIVAGARQRRVGSISAQLQRHAACPVLTVPSERINTDAPLRILAATDLSSCSEAAVEMAAALALELGAPMTLLHSYVAPIWVLPDGSSLAPSSEAQEKAAADSAQELSRLAARLARPGLAITTQSIPGDSAESILEVAHDYNLVVLGTHGRGGWKRLVLGSVAERVSRGAHVPVITAREAEPVAAHPPIL